MKYTVRLTDKYVDELQFFDNVGDVMEAQDRVELGLVVRASLGGKTFHVRGQIKTRGAQLTVEKLLGVFPDMSVAQARKAAEAFKRSRAAFDQFGPGHTLNQDLYLTTSEAAELLKMSVAWFERARWERAGPPYYKTGRAVRYLRSELIAWFDQQKVAKK